MDKIEEWNNIYKETYPDTEIPAFELIVCATQEELHKKRIELSHSKLILEELKTMAPKDSDGTFLVGSGGKYFILLLNAEDNVLAYEYWHELTHLLNYHNFRKHNGLSYEEILCCEQFLSKDELFAYLASDLIAFKNLCGDVDMEKLLDFAKNHLNEIIKECPTDGCDRAVYNIQRICGYVLAVQQACGELLIDCIPTDAQQYLFELNGEISPIKDISP